MPAAKRWKAEECEAAAKAYVVATHDEVSGAQQKSLDFGKKVHSAFKTLSPPGCLGTGTFWDRDPDGSKSIVWYYLRDTLLKECQKFNGTYNKTLAMNLTGVSQQQIINIAVAMHQKLFTSEGKSVYAYKDSDPNCWRLYTSWVVLKETVKFKAPTTPKKPSEEILDSGFVVSIDEAELEQRNNSEESSTSLALETASLNTTSKDVASLSGFVGRDKAKKGIIQEQLLVKRTVAIEDLAETEKKKLKVMVGLHDQALVRNLYLIVNDNATDAATKEQIRKRIHSIMNVTTETEQNNVSNVTVPSGNGNDNSSTF
jgi:hypothetical protein